jgi:hypothetical protein
VQQIERDSFQRCQTSIYIYDVKISGFTRSSIYDISRLRVKVNIRPTIGEVHRRLRHVRDLAFVYVLWFYVDYVYFLVYTYDCTGCYISEEEKNLLPVP